MRKLWIVVAERSQARIFTPQTSDGVLTEVHTLEHPQARRREQELVTDRPGRSFDSIGTGRHAMEPEVDHKREEVLRFAKQVAELIEHGRVERRFEHLILVAAPDFLGLLRQKLSPSALQMVSSEVPKNLSHYSPHEIKAHLANVPQVAASGAM